MEELGEIPEVSKVLTEQKERKKYSKREKIVKKEVDKFMPDEFEIFGDNWIPESEGDMVEGYVQPSEDYQGEFGPVPRVLIGEKRVFCGAGLRDLPKLEGKYVRVVYQGKQKSTKKGHQDFRKFQVLVRKEE
jgi:hypothetical protein